MFVTKFGGSILDGAEGVRRACREIARLPRPLVVVVSAFADVTNRLERLADTALHDPDAARTELDLLFADHADVARALMAEAEFERWQEGCAAWKTRLGEVIEGLSIVGELSPRTLDLTVHFGERLSSSIISSVLDAPCVSATDLLITDCAHRYARVEVELSRERVEENLRPLLQKEILPTLAVGYGESLTDGTDNVSALAVAGIGNPEEGGRAGGNVVVTEGYIARGTDGEITTMGRESSDFSAAILGELLDASEVRIYTGVPGVMTADPATVRDAATIPSMSYTMARELAVLGAKVLHPRTVRPVERAGIPLVITDLNGASTGIGLEKNDETFSVAAITDAALVEAELRVTGEGVDPFIRALSRTAPVIRYVLSGRHLRAVTAVAPSNLSDAVALTGGGVVAASATPVALVSLVRERRINADDAREFVSAVDRDSLLSFWTDPDERSVSALVPPERVESVVRDLHETVRRGGPQPLSRPL